VLPQVVDQDPYGRHQSTLRSEYKMDVDFLGVPIRQNLNEALRPKLILYHVRRQQGDPQTACGDLEQYVEIA
jgi:hypothetical protein